MEFNVSPFHTTVPYDRLLFRHQAQNVKYPRTLESNRHLPSRGMATSWQALG